MIGILTITQPAKADFGLFKFMGFIAALKYSASSFADIMDIVNGIRAKRQHVQAPQIVYINQPAPQPQQPRPVPYNPQYYANVDQYGFNYRNNPQYNWQRSPYCRCQGNYVCEAHGHYYH